MNKGRLLQAALVAVTLLIAACSSTPEPDTEERDRGPDRAPDLSDLEDVVPRDEPLSRYGNPESYEVFGQTYYVMAEMPETFEEEGIASWYGKKFHGRRTSSGEPYDMYKLTAAHRELPIPAYVRVTHLENGRSLVVRVNDRGPFARNRIIDLSYAAAQRLDMVETGTAPVRIELIRADRQPATAEADTGGGREPDGGVRPVAAQRLPGEVEDETGTRYFLQVGAFSERRNAERLKDNLDHARFSDVRIDNSDGGDFYRVRLGPMDSVEELDRVSRELQNHGMNGTRVVINP